MDGLFLGFIARELNAVLTGARVEKVQQPERDEVHILFRGACGPRRLLLSASAGCARIHLTETVKQAPMEPPMFCMVLRKHIGGARVLGVRQVGGDRLVEIEFACEDELGQPSSCILSCEVMGRHSNIILRSAQGRILDSIHHVGADISRVREVKPGLPYLPPPAQEKLDPFSPELTEEALCAALRDGAARLDVALAGALSGLGRESAQEIAFRLTGEEAPVTDAQLRFKLCGPLLAMLRQMPGWGPPVLLLDAKGEPEGAFAFEQARFSRREQKAMPGPSACAEAYYRMRDARARMESARNALARSLRTHLERCEKKLAIHEEALASEEKAEQLRVDGELLTANLHSLSKGREQAEVFDYYQNKTRVIALDARLTPAQNAQAYYKRYRKMRAARENALLQIDGLRAEQYLLEGYLDDLRKCERPQELGEIREALYQAGVLRAPRQRTKARKTPPSSPMQFLLPNGEKILVGRSGPQNDRLTAGAPPDAVWLHAKDIPGSHVILLCRGEPSAQALGAAAMLAAYYSKAYRASQVPVDYTLKKFVKKPSGAAPGRVIYTHQRTLFITPDERAVEALSAQERA